MPRITPRFLIRAARPLLLAAVLPVSAAGVADTACPENPAALLWTSPAHPVPGEPVKLMAVLTDGPAEALSATGPDGESIALDSAARGGPPWSLEAEFDPPRGGTYRVDIQRGGESIACRTVAVGSAAEGSGNPRPGEWNTAAEAFYAAWIEKLFDAPPDENLSFPSLEPVIRDPGRNFLYDHFGRNEDARLPATPDCADLPYFLRAYFAWKVGLPVAFRACDRGGAGRPPHCGAPNLSAAFTQGPVPTASFNGLMRKIADTVHSGSARTALSAEATDFYPLPLEREALWPGTVYADPYGHTLMLVRWMPQTAGRSGLLLAVDAQPDNSVSRKRFWEGTFLFADTGAAGPGFKAFRPVLRGGAGRWELPSNADLAAGGPVAPYSTAQGELAPEDFYARMGQLINPRGLAPRQAYEAMLDALAEQLQTRAESVENGEGYMRKHRGAMVPMPSGAAIFETQGLWEDYSTPSRDMRLLIAMKVLDSLPEHIVRYPDLFALGGQSPEAARAAIEALHRRLVQERRFSYIRSDGSAWELTVAEAMARRAAFETGYNPNDCAEARWGARPGTPEYATCSRHAPAEQRAKMEQYRAWFHETRRPTR
ncbi:hypothetical protein SAMN02949497_2166 [Methylomagnum ishizawai]|uniref:Uncharacterized protein n=1 Tax=Methylomagnum ishizawai TaxID=1760988 RepID=A0A1Y6CWT6_9GAMM|nr:hypothetical protein [Methylomagnum ishizawai]SMF94831.1 hypothetical protein SAMN02949497_2166 [Methylomagnum ishizawai]